MEYQVNVLIQQSIEKVVAAFTNIETMKAWEPGLLEVEVTKGKLFDKESEGYLVFQSGAHHQKMKLTVQDNQLPHVLEIIYEVPGAWNRCKNIFIQKGQETEWIMEVVFKFETENDYPKEAFINQTREGMMLFKHFVEKR